MPNVYIYKLTTDNGGAPCVTPDALSLALCKPLIRSSAAEGDIILGFAADSLYAGNCLVYAANVTRVIEDGNYFRRREFMRRADCIYRWNGVQFVRKPGAKFHFKDTDLEHDLGKRPLYPRARVLLSIGAENFRYYRGECRIRYQEKYPGVAALIARLKRGHRVNFGEDLRDEIRQLQHEICENKSVHTRSPVPMVARDGCTDDDDGFACGQC